MNRRKLFLSGSALALALALGACEAGMTPSQSITDVANKVSAIALGFSNALQVMTTTISVTGRAQATAILAQIQAAATALATTVSATAAKPIVQQVIAAVLQFAQLVPGLGLPVTIATTVEEIIAAAEVLLPVIAAEIPGTTVPASLARHPEMSIDRAMLVLTTHH